MTMNYRSLGGTGIEVSAYCLGTMMFGAAGNPDHDICIQTIRTALDRGINFVDTAKQGTLTCADMAHPLASASG